MPRSLRLGLYAEDLELCAKLYERRCEHLERPGVSLGEIAEIEERIDAHVDALARGPALVEEVCSEALDQGDAGQLHAAVRVLCRRGEASVLHQLELRLDGDPAIAPALRSALARELSPRWGAALESALASRSIGPLLARAIGVLRMAEFGDALTRLVRERKAKIHPDYVWAIGELRHRPALELLQVLLGHCKSQKLWTRVAITCLKLGDTRVAELLRKSESITRWSPLGQVLSFNVPSEWLLAELERWPAGEVINALALRGAPRTFDALIELLDEPKLAQPAAGALVLISGAPLLERDPDAASSQVRGLILPNEAAEPPADEWRLCHDPQVWREWFADHAREWPRGQRRRFGGVADRPTSLAAALCCALPLALREAVFDELALRFDFDTGLHPTSPARTLLDELGQQAGRAPMFERARPRLELGPLGERVGLRRPPTPTPARRG